VDVYQEDDFQGHQGSDLVDFEEVKPRWGGREGGGGERREEGRGGGEGRWGWATEQERKNDRKDRWEDARHTGWRQEHSGTRRGAR